VLALSPRVRQRLVIPPPNLLLKPPTAGDYLGIAKDMLFSKDRNPTVVVEPPKPAPEPVMPALPNYHGQMAIGEPVILLSASAAATQRSYHVGDQIGDFKLVSFDENRVAFEWKGKNVERKLEELKPKETATAAGAQASAQAARPAAPAATSSSATPARTVASLDHPNPVTPAASAVSNTSASDTPPPLKNVTSLGVTSNASNSASAGDTSGDSTFGPLLSSGDRACLPSDNSPVGTVHSGFMKVQSVGIFGASCSWTEVK